MLRKSLAIPAALCSLAACGTHKGPDSSHNIDIRTAPLNLPGIDFACYDVLVENGAATPETVIARGTVGQSLADGDTTTLCSTRFGNGPGGDISYVAPCDAQLPGHTVTLWVDGVYTGTPQAPVMIEYQDPCPAGCVLPVTCVENADTPVTFNLTIMRPANQGFFDIGVNFDDIFCSAKVDCETDGGLPLNLLHHPVSKERGQTAVLALACTAGPGAADDTVLFRDPIVVTCAGMDPIVLDPTLGEGNVFGPIMADPDPADPVWQYATYFGDEALDCGGESCNKRFWNVAIGFDATASDCTLTTLATAASASQMPAFVTPDASTYPYLTVDVQLTSDGGGLACGQHPLNGTDPGVATAYTEVAAPQQFCHRYDGAGMSSDACLSIATIAALRDVVEPFPNTLIVHNHSTAGDLGGGRFTWDPTATGDDNNGTIISPNGWSGAGRWVRQYAGAVRPAWFGALGNGVSDDCTPLQAAIDTGEDVDFDAGTYSVGCRLQFHASNVVYDGFGQASLVFAMGHTERLADVTGSNIRWQGLEFNGGGRQVWGGLIYIKDDAAQPVFSNCVFRDIAGTQQGQGSSPRYNQYAVLISPYGVSNFAFSGCQFRNITNDNSGFYAPALEGGGFAGGVFFNRDDFLEPNDPQTIPTSGTFANCHFEDIRTKLASGLQRAAAITFDDADAIRFYGGAEESIALPVVVRDSTFRNISKRAVKGADAFGQELLNLVIEATDLAYPMVTAIKVGQGMQINGVEIIADASQPIDTLFQIHNASNASVQNITANHAWYVWNFAPLGPDYTMENILVSNVTVANLYKSGFAASGTLAGGANLRFEAIDLTAAPGAHDVSGFLGPVTAPSGLTGIVLEGISLTNMDLKLEGKDLSATGVTIVVDRPEFAGSSPSRALVEIGFTPGAGETTNQVSNLVVDATGLASDFLNVTRNIGVMALFGDGATYNQLELRVPDDLSASFPHLNIFGSRVTSDGFTYYGRGYNFVSTEAGGVYGPYADVTISNWTRTSVNPATTALTRFIYLNAGQSNTISDVFDELVGTGPSIDINGGTVAQGETYAYFVSNVGSRTTGPTIVQHGGLALLDNVYYLP